MPDIYGNPTESELRSTGYAPNTMAAATPGLGWYGQIGNSTMYLGGLNANATPQEAAAYYAQQAQQPGSQFGVNRGFVDPSVYAAAFPNGDQAAYADLYRSTQRDINRGPLGVGSNLSRAAQFELDHVGNIFEGLVDEPGRLVFGFDPIGTEIGNAVTGRNYDPLVNQMGGATSQQIRDYEAKHGLNSAGGAQGLHNAAAGTAGIIALGNALSGGWGQGGAGGAGGGSGGGSGGGYGGGSGGGSGIGSASAPLEEIVVTGVRGAGAGLTPVQQGLIGAGIGAGAAGLGSALPNMPAPTNYGDAGGWQANNDPLGSFGNGIGSGSNAGDLVLSGGAGTTGGLFGGAGGSVWEDLIPLAGQLIGSWMDGKGAKDASQAQVAAALAGIAEQRRQYDTSRADQKPWLDAGTAALGRLQDPNAFTTSPGYNFVRSEGNRDIGNSFAARGGALSGNALRALDQYNTGLASQEYNNWFNQNASLAGVGQASAQNLAGLGANSANNVSNLLTNQGNARASGILGQTDAYTNGLNQLGQWYGNYRRSREGAY